MLYALWFISSDGTPLYFKNYGNYKVDPILFSGFVSALFNFTKELGTGSLRELSMGNSKLIIYYFIEGFLTVIAASPKDEPKRYEGLINKIRNRIIRRYNLIGGTKDEKLLKNLESEFEDILEDFRPPLLELKFDEIPFMRDPKIRYFLYRMIKDNIGSIEPILPGRSEDLEYPYLKEFTGFSNSEIKSILDELEKVHIFLKKPLLNILMCPQCNTMSLYPTLVCENCKDSPLVREIFIEHFECGYTAPEEKFESVEGLLCPNCGKRLVKEGIEFRRYVGYLCPKCGMIETDPKVKLICSKCKSIFVPDPKILKNRIVYRYRMNEDVSEELLEYLKSYPTKLVARPKKEEFRTKFHILKRMAEIREEISALNERFYRREIDSRTYAKNLSMLKKELSELRDRLSRMRTPSSV
ncbi:MAG: hypothetical protein ACTSR0_02950 [Candidatus Asgardarchaeia archaeon]